jgi:Ca-activated chloride channel family protein
MAERPVVIFGKWHGEPAGEIIIQGISGNHHFSKKIEIEKAKRSRSYKGLRYLWARHRAAILSDYNKLDKQDERTREITNLGLKYNLLTAYTSFVAIDSRVRGEGEKPMTIKQPLPLPQGVSDYAVGRGKAAFSKRPVLSQPLSPGNTEVASSLGDRKHEYDKEGGNSIKSNAENEKAVENKILLGSITISGGLLKDDVKLTLDKKMPLLNQCIKKGSRGLMPVNGIFFKLVVDSNGDVKKVVEMGQVKIRKQLMECIRETLKGAKFSKVKKGEKAVIIVQFLLR